MELKFRNRDYKAEVDIYSLRRIQTEFHPLSPQSPLCDQVDVKDYAKDEFFDPLRGNNGKPEDSTKDLKSTTIEITTEPYMDVAIQFSGKEWTSYKKVLMQKFPVSKMISVSSLSSSIMKTGKGTEKLSANVHLEELDDPQRFADEGVKYVTLKEYVSRLTELKDEISRSWHANDRVTSLNLSIKVARLLSDTSVLQFYPTLFVLATEILDMLGDMVWERIRQRAEYTEEGTLVRLPDNFRATDICVEAKETCYNWFCKVGSIRELLPRIYLELAIFRCWCFLLERPVDNLQRLVMMARGIADPLASFYCRLYLAHCAQKLAQPDIGENKRKKGRREPYGICL